VIGPRKAGMRAAHLWRPERATDVDPPHRADIPRLSTLYEVLDEVGAHGRR
jgi:hypothetical protein